MSLKRNKGLSDLICIKTKVIRIHLRENFHCEVSNLLVRNPRG